MACFGAQAVLVRIVIFYSHFSERTVLMSGLADSLPFFAFDYYLYFVAKMFTD